MKKVLRYLLMTVMALCISLPCLSAEAASVALLPLINNVEGKEIINQVFYKEAIGALNSNKGFVMVENDQLTAAIEAANIGKEVPNEATLRKIAKDGKVDMVIAIQLDELSDEYIASSQEDRVKLDLQGRTVAYNALTGNFYEHRMYSDSEIPAALTARWDWTAEEFGREVRREINRVLKAK